MMVGTELQHSALRGPMVLASRKDLRPLIATAALRSMYTLHWMQDTPRFLRISLRIHHLWFLWDSNPR